HHHHSSKHISKRAHSSSSSHVHNGHHRSRSGSSGAEDGEQQRAHKHHKHHKRDRSGTGSMSASDKPHKHKKHKKHRSERSAGGPVVWRPPHRALAPAVSRAKAELMRPGRLAPPPAPLAAPGSSAACPLFPDSDEQFFSSVAPPSLKVGSLSTALAKGGQAKK